MGVDGRPRLLPYCKQVELIVKPKKHRKAYFQEDCSLGTSSSGNNPYECIGMCRELGYSFAGVKFLSILTLYHTKGPKKIGKI